MLKQAWNTFKSKPLKFGGGIFLIVLAVFIFFGTVNFKAKHGDTEVEISTQLKR